MKTLHIFLACFFPLFSFGQSIADSSLYPIVVKGERLIAQSQAESAILYAEQILSQPSPDSFKKRQAFFVIGRAKFEDGKPEEAIVPFQKSIVLCQKSQDNPLLLKSLIAVSAALGDKESPEFDSVMLYLEGAKNLAEIIHDTASLAMIYIYRSNISFLNEEFNQALENNYLCESLLKNSRFEYERALNNYGKANNLMEVYYREGKDLYLEEARISYQDAVNVFNKQGRKSSEAHARNALGGNWFYFNDLKKAEEEINESVRLGIGLGDESILLNGYYTLASLYEMQNKEAEGIFALRELKNILEKRDRTEDVTFIKEQFSNNEVKISSALINNKIAIFENQLENRQLEKTMLLGGFIAILIIGIITSLLIYYRQKTRLALQKQKIAQEELQNTLNTKEIEFMRARFEGEEEGRHRIARQIHDGVGGLLVSAKWNLESALEEISKKEIKVAARLNENLRLQENSYKELRRVVYELEREDIPWWEDLQKLYQQLADRNTTKIRFYTFNLDKKVGGAIGEEARLIVQEIITNALKHGKATEINVQISQIEDVLGIIIEDNGIGFDQNKVVKGIGLKSIEERCSKLGGEISIETGKGAGTTVFIDIPVSKQNILKENPLLYAGTN